MVAPSTTAPLSTIPSAGYQQQFKTDYAPFIADYEHPSPLAEYEAAAGNAGQLLDAQWWPLSEQTDVENLAAAYMLLSGTGDDSTGFDASLYPWEIAYNAGAVDFCQPRLGAS
jgi:hypothetical protein